MADYTITLTADEIEALEEMLGLESLTEADIENYIKNQAQSAIRSRVNEEWEAKTIEDKKTLLGDSFSIKK